MCVGTKLIGFSLIIEGSGIVGFQQECLQFFDHLLRTDEYRCALVQFRNVKLQDPFSPISGPATCLFYRYLTPAGKCMELPSLME